MSPTDYIFCVARTYSGQRWWSRPWCWRVRPRTTWPCLYYSAFRPDILEFRVKSRFPKMSKTIFVAFREVLKIHIADKKVFFRFSLLKVSQKLWHFSISNSNHTDHFFNFLSRVTASGHHWTPNIGAQKLKSPPTWTRSKNTRRVDTVLAGRANAC